MIAVVMRILFIIVFIVDLAVIILRWRPVFIVRVRSQRLERVVQLGGRPAVSLEMVSEDGPARPLLRLLQHKSGRLLIAFFLKNPHRGFPRGTLVRRVACFETGETLSLAELDVRLLARFLGVTNLGAIAAD